jgi:hypothetical protein
MITEAGEKDLRLKDIGGGNISTDFTQKNDEKNFFKCE